MKREAIFPGARWLILAGLAAALTACGFNNDDLYDYIDGVKAQPGGAIEPLPQPRPAPRYVYVPGDRRSPFVPDTPLTVLNPDPNAIQGPDPDRPREFLEGLPLDSLTMVGTLRNSTGDFGLVQDREGRVHPVTVGNHLGFDYGRVIDITETEIALVEIVNDGLGGWMERTASINIGLSD